MMTMKVIVIVVVVVVVVVVVAAVVVARSTNDRTILVKPHKNYVAYGKRSFSYVAPTMWNRLPRYIRESDSIETFKRQLKNHLFTTTYSRQ